MRLRHARVLGCVTRVRAQVHVPSMEELMKDDEEAERDEKARKELEEHLMASHGSVDAQEEAEAAAAEDLLDALLEANEDEDPQDLDEE